LSSIGSLGKGFNEQGVQNVTVKTTVFTGTENGLRIKTWGRLTDAFVRGVVFEHAVMQNVQNPIIIDQNYCPDNKGCPDQVSKIIHADEIVFLFLILNLIIAIFDLILKLNECANLYFCLLIPPIPDLH
jgi:Glycosyl hydrolases family 28